MAVGRNDKIARMSMRTHRLTHSDDTTSYVDHPSDLDTKNKAPKCEYARQSIAFQIVTKLYTPFFQYTAITTSLDSYR